VPFLVDFGGLEAKPTHLRDPSRSAARAHRGQVAGINRNRWLVSAGLGCWFRPDWVAGFGRNAHEVATAKGAQPRTAYPAPWAAAALDEWLCVRGRSPGPLLRACDAAGAVLEGGMSGEAIRRRLRRRAAQGALEAVRPHDGRRSYISALLQVTDLSTAALAAGHAKTTSTLRYDRRPATRVATAAATLSLDDASAAPACSGPGRLVLEPSVH